MNFLLNLALVLQILSAIALVVLILLQHGKGADMGASFGGGASGSLFGASGSANFLSHATAVLATIFLVTTLALAHFGYSVPTSPSGGSVLDRGAVTAPAAPASQKESKNAPASTAPAAPAGVGTVPESVVPAAGNQKPATPPAPATPAAPASPADQIPTK